MAPAEDGTEGLGLSIQDLMAYFYADHGLIALTHLERLQKAFNVLTGLFNWVGLRNNMRNMVSIACQPCHTPGRMSLAAYEQRTIGMGPIFWERQWRRVACPECGVEVTAGLLLTYR